MRIMPTVIVACVSYSAALGGAVMQEAERAGLSPRNLVVAGLSASQVGSVFDALAQATSQRASLALCESQVDAAAATLSTARQALALSPRDPEAKLAVKVAKGQYESAVAAAIAAKQALREAALDGISAECRTRLSRVWQRAASKLPLANRVADVSDEQWRLYELALTKEQTAAEQSLPVEPEVAATLVELRSNSEAVNAGARLDATLAQALERVASY